MNNLLNSSEFIVAFITVILTTPAAVWYTYYVTSSLDHYYALRNFIEEISGNLWALSESEFERDLQELIRGPDLGGRLWLTGGVAFRVASGSEDGYLMQYLLDHAYSVFINKGYLLDLQEKLTGSKYVRGGPIYHIALFFFHCSEFNRLARNQENEISGIRQSGQSISPEMQQIQELRNLRQRYFRLLETDSNNISISNMQFILKDIKYNLVAFFIVSIFFGFFLLATYVDLVKFYF